jgi:ABC-type bacteriocin/lantibiotic exporter with double-glycine peptidase domain
MIEIRDLNIVYNSEIIYSDFNFSVPKNTKLAITGESGRGKSTLLNALLGFVPDFRGEILVDNILLSPKNIRSIRSKIAYLPQDISFNFDSVSEMFFALFDLELNRDRRPDKNSIAEIFDAFKLSEKILEKRVKEISGGQRQRVLLAINMLMNKPIVMLDEPTAALDAKLKEIVCDYILTQEDKTVIAVTHDDYWINKSDAVLNL